MLTGLTPSEERALVEALRPLFRLYVALPRDRHVGYQGPVEALSLYPILIGAKPDGDAVLSDPAAMLDGLPSLCWRDWARVDADEILAQASPGPRTGGVKLVDIFSAVAGKGLTGPGGVLLELFRKAGDSR